MRLPVACWMYVETGSCYVPSRLTHLVRETNISMPRLLTSKVTGPIAEFGLIAGLLYGIDELFCRFGSRFRIFCYEIMIQPIAAQPIAPPSLTKNIRVREVPREDPVLEQFPPSQDALDQRYSQGAVCLGAFNAESLIGYQWLCFGPYEEDEVRCTFVPEPSTTAVFDFDFYVYPEQRFGIGFVALWDGTSDYLRERGIEYSCSRVSYFNTASRKSHKHFKWKRAGLAVFLRGRSWQLMVSTLAPYLHVSFSKSSRPRIRVSTVGFSALRD